MQPRVYVQLQYWRFTLQTFTHRMFLLKLYQIPEVSIQVFKYGNSAVIRLFGFSYKVNAVFLHIPIVSFEIIRRKKQEDTATCLITDKSLLSWFGSLCEQNRRSVTSRR